MKDVAVIGAGPAGLHVAYRLAARGLDVILLEAQRQIGEGAICSGVIGHEAYLRFALPASPVLTHIHCIQAFSPEGRVLEHRTDSPLACVVEKSEFNRALSRRTMAAHVDVRLGRRVESLEREKHGLLLRFRSHEAENGVLRASVAVIASGVNLLFNRAFGLGRPRQFLRAMQSEVCLPNGDGSDPTRIYVGRSVAPAGFGWVIPLGHGRSRIGLMTTHNPKAYFTALLGRVAPRVVESQLKVSQKAIAQASVGRCVADRIVAVGEAAGHVKTSTGGGIYYGLLSAEFAAEAILRAFKKGNFASSVLADFERYSFSAFGTELMVGYLARGLAARLPDRLVERIFASAKSTSFLARLNGKLRFDWHEQALLAALRSWPDFVG